MKIGFTGALKGMTKDQQLSLGRTLMQVEPTEFHHSDFVGADAQAHQIAQLLKVPALHIWPGLTDSTRAFMKGARLHAAQGILGRIHSLVAATDVLIAAAEIQGTEEKKSEVWAAIRQARRACKPTFIIWPNGEVAYERSDPTPLATPKPKQSPGPCIYKIREVRSPIGNVLRGYRILVAVPNMDGHEPFSTLPAPSFAPKYLIYESSDYAESEIMPQLKRIFTNLLKAGYTEIDDAETFADKANDKAYQPFNPAQHKTHLTEAQKAEVEYDWMRGNEWFYNQPYVW